MTPLVRAVLKRIDARTTYSEIEEHPADVSFKKCLLKWLYQHNERLNIEKIKDWAMQRNWSEKQVNDFIYWVREITEGECVLIKYRPLFSDNYFKDLLEEVKQEYSEDLTNLK